MPFVVVTAPGLADEMTESRALTDLAGRVAVSLGLNAPDVLAVLVRSAGTADGAGRPDPWPLVTFLGSRRPAAAQEAAEAVARQLVAAAWQVSTDRVWTQWLVRADPRQTSS